MQTISWMLTNIVREREKPRFKVLKPIINPLSKIICSQHEDELLNQCCWVLSYIMDEGGQKKIDTLVGSGAIPRIVELLTNANANIVLACLRILGNVSSGKDEDTQLTLDCGIAGHLRNLLENTSSGIRKEAAWVASNIAAGSLRQVQQLFDSGVMVHLIELSKSDDFQVRKEAIYALSNATNRFDKNQMEMLIKFRVMECFASILSCNEITIISVALDAVGRMLERGKYFMHPNDHNPIAIQFDEAGGVTNLELLQHNSNSLIYKTAMQLIEKYFGCYEDILVIGEPSSNPLDYFCF